MYFLYLKADGTISPPVKSGEPESATIDKELNCSLGSGIKWDNVDVFYADDSEFTNDFIETASQGQYYIENNTVKENLDWTPPEEPEEWL